MKICPMATQNYQSRYKNWLNNKQTLEKLPNTLRMWPKWRNFDNSGHTGPNTSPLQKNSFIHCFER